MRKPKMPSGTQFVEMPVEMSDGTEREIRVRFYVNPAERATEFYPGCPTHAEFEGAVFCDGKGGEDVPDDLVDIEDAEARLWDELKALAERAYDPY